MRQADVPIVGPMRTFRYSPVRALVAGSLVLDAVAALTVVGWMTANVLAYYGAGVLFLALWVFRKMILARFRPTNWLVRLGDDGLYIKLRSYLNDHILEDGATAAFIAYREIRRARLIRETREVPNGDRAATTIQRRVLIELELRQKAPELDRAIAAERSAKAPRVRGLIGSGSTTYRHYPVRMSSSRVMELEWGVVPAAPTLLTALAVHCDVEAVDAVKDYTNLGGLDRKAQESRLLELATSGQKIAAIKLARSLYGYDLTAATGFVDGLLGRRSA